MGPPVSYTQKNNFKIAGPTWAYMSATKNKYGGAHVGPTYHSLSPSSSSLRLLTPLSSTTSTRPPPPTAVLPVVFVDGDQTVDLGTVTVQPFLGVRKLRVVVADRVGLVRQQILASLARPCRARRVPFKEGTELTAAVRTRVPASMSSPSSTASAAAAAPSVLVVLRCSCSRRPHRHLPGRRRSARLNTDRRLPRRAAVLRPGGGRRAAACVGSGCTRFWVVSIALLQRRCALSFFLGSVGAPPWWGMNTPVPVRSGLPPGGLRNTARMPAADDACWWDFCSGGQPDEFRPSGGPTPARCVPHVAAVAAASCCSRCCFNSCLCFRRWNWKQTKTNKTSEQSQKSIKQHAMD
ncbi:Os06g0688850 [Oryza sativa Japonica Group]|uniref:Os06g0688850 protein n=1 Tax=Oryza sativa subsp. japonica TaxID=39947 RepID=A0A0P0X0M2_ORYSJ|nr:hypothetical protein EE612_036169 [Oryza sativa]BAS99218.1 Os06g0688850 [Oryza sativa Japonica Group]